MTPKSLEEREDGQDTVVTHRGEWNEDSRASQALRFIESFIQAVDSNEREKTPWNKFFASMAVCHDVKGQAHIGGKRIWEHIGRQLFPFSIVRNSPIEIRVLPPEIPSSAPVDSPPSPLRRVFPTPDSSQPLSPSRVVYGQFLTHYTLKDDAEEEEILVPRFMTWTLSTAEDREGTEGLQVQEMRQFWDTGIIARVVTERKRMAGKKRRISESEEVQ